MFKLRSNVIRFRPSGTKARPVRGNGRTPAEKTLKNQWAVREDRGISGKSLEEKNEDVFSPSADEADGVTRIRTYELENTPDGPDGPDIASNGAGFTPSGTGYLPRTPLTGEENPRSDMTRPVGKCRSCRYLAPLFAERLCGACLWADAQMQAAAERAVLSPDALADEAELMLYGEPPP